MILTSFLMVFQSTPLPTGRSDSPLDALIPVQAVSIHAPPNRKERPAAINPHSGFLTFQSTPLPTGRSDSQLLNIATNAEMVSIHAPPNRKERLVRRREQMPHSPVSIHAPPNRKERPAPMARWTAPSPFQSTPLPTGRSDA